MMPDTHSKSGSKNARTDILIVGGSTGGCAAAMSATALGKRVIMTEETDWVGGQLTSQAVPPDEHSWIESFGCTARYRKYRNAVRQYYREHYPLTLEARSDPFLNPGNGFVSRLCHEPRIGLVVLEQMLAYPRASRKLEVRTRRKPVSAVTEGDRITAVTLLDLETETEETIEADFVLDATELGDLLPMAGVEYVTGFESQSETGEPHALPGDAEPDNVQPLSWVFAAGYDPDGDHTIDKPAQFDFWSKHIPNVTPPWGGPLLSWERRDPFTGERVRRGLFPHETENPGMSMWHWRRIICRDHYLPEVMPYEATLVIWAQNDYFLSNIIDKPEAEVRRCLEEARQLSLSFLYWLQTESPRSDGKNGYPGLFLWPELVGTEDGLAKAPYIRESRRIKAVFTVTEEHIGAEARGDCGAEEFSDSIGIGCYHIDLHASTGGNNKIALESLPFQIPLGALLPIRVDNLLPACKNIGTTHLTNGAYRLHPVEWNIGESAGLLAAFCLQKNTLPRAVREDEALLLEFQSLCLSQGIELQWPKLRAEDGWAAFDRRVLGQLPRGAQP
jgi:hypothetical protein